LGNSSSDPRTFDWELWPLKMLAALLFIALPAVIADNCGGTNKCGSAFSSMSCKAACCHDAFNAWCCPPDGPWTCGSTFQHDSSHCNAPNSCSCQQEPQVVRVVASGHAQTSAATGIDSTICCGPNTNCGNQIQQTFTSSTSASWSKSTTVGLEITMKESLLVEGLEVKISMSGTWTNGGSKTHSDSVAGTDHCDRVDTGLTFVSLKCDAVELTVPVTYTYEQCGKISTVQGTVTSTQINQACACYATECKKGCDPHSGCYAAADALNTTLSQRALRMGS